MLHRDSVKSMEMTLIWLQVKEAAMKRPDHQNLQGTDTDGRPHLHRLGPFSSHLWSRRRRCHFQEEQDLLDLEEKRVTEGSEERKETGVQLGQRENLALALALALGVEPVERRENQVKKEQRAVQASATKEPKESLAFLALLAPPALQDQQLTFQSAAMDPFLPESLAPEDQLDHRVLQAPRAQQELMESQVTPVRMEKRVLKDLQASQEPQVTPAPKERREIVERGILAPGDPLDLQDLQDRDTDLLSWTWRVLGSLIWKQFGGLLVSLVLLAPLVLLVPLREPLGQALALLDYQEGMVNVDNQVYLVCREPMVCQELLVPRERRVIQESWVFQELLERRDLEEKWVYQDLQEKLA